MSPDFLLGALEAGFFPGIILYLTYWYHSARRGQIIAMFMTATAIASVIAGPLSGATMKYFNDIEGWHGWQWLFISRACRVDPRSCRLLLSSG